jgi:hypothetical protein
MGSRPVPSARRAAASTPPSRHGDGHAAVVQLQGVGHELGLEPAERLPVRPLVAVGVGATSGMFRGMLFFVPFLGMAVGPGSR